MCAMVGCAMNGLFDQFTNCTPTGAHAFLPYLEIMAFIHVLWSSGLWSSIITMKLLCI